MKMEKTINISQGSHGHDQPVDATEQGIPTGLSSHSENIQKQFKLLKVEENQDQNSKPLIQKVPFLLRGHKKFKKYYEPRAISLGPFHHGKPELMLAEKYKLKFAKLFIKESGQTAEILYETIKLQIDKFKECFDFEDEATKKYNDEDLSWMLFIDGCSTLEYIHCAVKGELKKMKIKNDQAAIAQQDLFLLENQLPFELLESLMKLSANGNSLRESIGKFIAMNTIAPQEEVQQNTPEHQQANAISGNPAHLLELLRIKLLGSSRLKGNTSKKAKENNWQSFRNVEELKSAGIQLKRSKKSYLTDISFSSMCFAGYLHLPPITVDDSTAPKLLNLVAYEMCPDFANDFEVSSYVCFLDSLIDEPNDVKSLRSAHILHNFLGSDEEVANLFNEISTDLVPNPDAYSDVKAEIEKHYNSIYMIWMAQVYHQHFSNPWTILACGAAIVAIFLTGVETWFAVFSPSPCDKVCSHLAKTLNKK